MRANQPRRPEGSGPEAIFAQAVWDQLWGGGLAFIDSPTVKFSRTTRGISADAYADAGRRLSIILTRLKSVAADYLVCKAWDGTETGETASDASPDLYIAKPASLRNSIVTETIEGEVFTYTYAAGPSTVPAISNVLRTATVLGVTREVQIVTPEWLVNFPIYAVPCVTGVFRSPAETDPVTLLMLGDGRGWAVHA